MARPRLILDDEKIREMLRRKCGSRRIARELDVSRSLIQRTIAGTRFAPPRDHSVVAEPRIVHDDTMPTNRCRVRADFVPDL